jgi:hypothetical protein
VKVDDSVFVTKDGPPSFTYTSIFTLEKETVVYVDGDVIGRTDKDVKVETSVFVTKDGPPSFTYANIFTLQCRERDSRLWMGMLARPGVKVKESSVFVTKDGPPSVHMKIFKINYTIRRKPVVCNVEQFRQGCDKENREHRELRICHKKRSAIAVFTTVHLRKFGRITVYIKGECFSFLR